MMGWSLSHDMRSLSPDAAGVALLAGGKALYLANAFEAKCRYVLRIANLVSIVDVHPGTNFDEAVAKDRLLHPTLEDLKAFPMVTKDDVEPLDRARRARNFVAHEGGAFGYIFDATDQHIRRHLDRLRMAVVDLANRDNIVSRWVYEIDEKEPAPPLMTMNYPSLVEEWVFADGRRRQIA